MKKIICFIFGHNWIISEEEFLEWCENRRDKVAYHCKACSKKEAVFPNVLP